MRLRVWFALGLLLLVPHISLAQTCPGQNAGLVPFAKETKTISTSPAGFTPGVFDTSAGRAVFATVEVRDSAILYDVVGTPAAPDSLNANVGASFPICGIDSIRAFKAIRSTATDARLIVRYYKSK